MTNLSDTQPLDTRAKSEVTKPGVLEKYFRAMQKLGASDLHLKAGVAPHFRTRQAMRRTTADALTAEQVDAMATELMTANQQAYYKKHGSIDLAYELAGEDRFRINIYRQRGETSVAVRRVTRQIPSGHDLHLPEVVLKIAEAQQGLVLLAGPTGCGKSTTIASMLQHVNETRACHIVTIEDPIEYLYDDSKALVSQREIGIDVDTFPTALRSLMRQDPDVVLIGEMRDPETFEAALQASETGHLVFGTVHASSAPQTIERILALFGADRTDLIRQSLAFNLKAVICQKLLPSIAEDVDRVPAVEIMLATPIVRQYVEEGRDQELVDIVHGGERDGMQTFTRSLLKLIETEYVDPRVAYEVAPNPDELKMMLKGISSGQSGLVGR